MKLKTTYLFLAFAFIFSASAFAQVDRSVGRGQYRPSRNTAEKKDFVEQTVDFLTKELKLDDFQKAVVKTIVEKERGAITALNEDKSLSLDERKDKARAISDRVYTNVMPLLSKEQGEIYTKLKEAKKF